MDSSDPVDRHLGPLSCQGGIDRLLLVTEWSQGSGAMKRLVLMVAMVMLATVSVRWHHRIAFSTDVHRVGAALREPAPARGRVRTGTVAYLS
jgi:hypothetical protein